MLTTSKFIIKVRYETLSLQRNTGAHGLQISLTSKLNGCRAVWSVGFLGEGCTEDGTEGWMQHQRCAISAACATGCPQATVALDMKPMDLSTTPGLDHKRQVYNDLRHLELRLMLFLDYA